MMKKMLLGEVRLKNAARIARRKRKQVKKSTEQNTRKMKGKLFEEVRLINTSIRSKSMKGSNQIKELINFNEILNIWRKCV